MVGDYNAMLAPSKWFNSTDENEWTVPAIVFGIGFTLIFTLYMLSNLFAYLKRKYQWFYRPAVYQPPHVYSPYIKRKIVPNIKNIKLDGAEEKTENAMKDAGEEEKKVEEVDESITMTDIRIEVVVNREDEGAEKDEKGEDLNDMTDFSVETVSEENPQVPKPLRTGFRETRLYTY